MGVEHACNVDVEDCEGFYCDKHMTARYTFGKKTYHVSPFKICQSEWIDHYFKHFETEFFKSEAERLGIPNGKKGVYSDWCEYVRKTVHKIHQQPHMLPDEKRISLHKEC